MSALWSLSWPFPLARWSRTRGGRPFPLSGCIIGTPCLVQFCWRPRLQFSIAAQRQASAAIITRTPADDTTARHLGPARAHDAISVFALHKLHLCAACCARTKRGIGPACDAAAQGAVAARNLPSPGLRSLSCHARAPPLRDGGVVLRYASSVKLSLASERHPKLCKGKGDVPLLLGRVANSTPAPMRAQPLGTAGGARS